MANNSNMIPIPGRLHSVATGGQVTGANEIYDDVKGVFQDVINGAVLEEKVYVPADYSGMGRVVLKKNIVEGVNTLTQDMFYKGEVGSRVPNTDTIFVIQYDFTLAEDITIPANCVLQFDGGSISGEFTLTGTNTCIEAGYIGIFHSNVLFGGTWNVEKVIANWFISDSDSAMFNVANAFARIIASNEWDSFNRMKVTLTCAKKVYRVSETIFIGSQVCFDGNQCTFWPTAAMNGRYCFKTNFSNYDTPSSYIPSQEGLWFGNFIFYNHNTTAYCVNLADGRHVRDIEVFDYPKNIVVFADQYIDMKKISRVWISEEKTKDNKDYSSLANFRNCCSIYIGLGDAAVLEQVVADVFIAAGATVSINGFMGTVGVINANVSICNIHTEAEPLLLIGGAARVSVKNYNGWRPKLVDGEYNIISFASWDTAKPCIDLEDVIIGNITMKRAAITEDPDYGSYRLVKGSYCALNVKNVYAAMPHCHRSDAAQDIHIYGGSIYMLPITPDGQRYLQNNDFYVCGTNTKELNILKQNVSNFNIKPVQGSGSNISIRLVFFADVEKKIVIGKTDIVSSVRDTKGSFTINGYAASPKGAILRIEIGATPTLTHYLDIAVGVYANLGIFTEIVDGLPVINTFDCTPIDYVSADLINAYSYKNISGHREVVLDTTVNSLPDASLFDEGDIVSLYNGKRNRKIGSNWVEI